MLQDRSLANQFIQGTQGFFGSHNVQCFGGSLPERKSKKFLAGVRASNPVPLEYITIKRAASMLEATT